MKLSTKFIRVRYRIGESYLIKRRDLKSHLDRHDETDIYAMDYSPSYTAMELALFLEDDMENANMHASSGIYEKIAEKLIELYKEDGAILFMEWLYESGGLLS